jgi:rod shape-determining protein MreD
LLYVFLLLLTSQVSLLVLKMFTGSQPAGWQYFLPSISGVLLWRIALMMGLKTGARSSGA